MDLLQTLEYSGSGTKANLCFAPSMGWVPQQFVVALELVKKSRRLGYTQSRQGLFTENICKDMGQKGLRRKSVGWREM